MCVQYVSVHTNTHRRLTLAPMLLGIPASHKGLPEFKPQLCLHSESPACECTKQQQMEDPAPHAG